MLRWCVSTVRVVGGVDGAQRTRFLLLGNIKHMAFNRRSILGYCLLLAPMSKNACRAVQGLGTRANDLLEHQMIFRSLARPIAIAP
jgi:hypothetical protein